MPFAEWNRLVTRAILMTRTTMSPTSTKPRCLPSRCPRVITSFSPATISGKLTSILRKAFKFWFRRVLSGTHGRGATERQNTENLYTSSAVVPPWNNGGVSTATSCDQQNSSPIGSCISLRAASNRCGKTPKTSGAASGSYACERTKSTGPGRTFAWRCWASNSWSAPKSAALSFQLNILKTYFPSGIARRRTSAAQIE